MTWTYKVIHRQYIVPKDLESRDYLPKPPPPPDDRCEVCGKYPSELKPFGGCGDPLGEELRGEILVLTWRRAGPYDEEAQKAWEEADKAMVDIPDSEDSDHLLRWFTTRYGKRKGKRLYHKGRNYRWVLASWECRDCIVLDENQYFEKLRERHRGHRIE